MENISKRGRSCLYSYTNNEIALIRYMELKMKGVVYKTKSIHEEEKEFKYLHNMLSSNGYVCSDKIKYGSIEDIKIALKELKDKGISIKNKPNTEDEIKARRLYDAIRKRETRGTAKNDIQHN